MRVLIIGGNGAIGSAIARVADAVGIDTHVGVRTTASMDRLSAHPRIGAWRLDATDGDSVRRTLVALQPDWIVMSALPRVGHSPDSKSREELLLGMCRGLFGVMEGARDAGFGGTLTWIGSAMCYGTGRGPREPDGALRPQTFRGAVKAAESMLAARLAADAGIGLNEVRVFTGYGAYEQRERLVASLLRAGLGGERVRLAERPALRDWVHYDDIARACIASASPGAPAVFNACTGRLHDTHQIARLLERISGRPLVSDVAYDCGDRYGDVEPGALPEASGDFQWAPLVDLGEGLERSWEWACSPAGRDYLFATVPA
ncbi:MAG: NAD-dependent epimerase/dehydratase family protein [Luteimonas sp.]